MCRICGCSDDTAVTVTNLQQGEPHKHSHGDGHMHSHGDGHMHSHSDGHVHTHDGVHVHDHRHNRRTTVQLNQAILTKNDQIAQSNREWLRGRRTLALNLVSAPGAGKTTLLERTLTALRGEFELGVIEGDQETLRDAERIRGVGCPAVQINTGAGCHLDAEMVAKGLELLAPRRGSVVMIENVGNLVCPALFDIGENARIVILSVTEGDDKPLKYPHMFRSSQLFLLNKVDLLPYVSFNVEACLSHARRVNPSLVAMQVSATTGEGMEAWYTWLRQQAAAAARAASVSP